MHLVKRANISNKDEYILAYILDPNPEIGFRLEKLSIDKNIKILILLDHLPSRKEKNKKKLLLSGKGNIEVKNIFHIEDWLWYFNNSKNIITDSYHGTIFSIIFRKPFISLKNQKRGGDRFISLLRPLNLIHRLFEKSDCINKRYDLYDTINYSLSLPKLLQIKDISYNWLKNKLEIIFN